MSGSFPDRIGARLELLQLAYEQERISCTNPTRVFELDALVAGIGRCMYALPGIGEKAGPELVACVFSEIERDCKHRAGAKHGGEFSREWYETCARGVAEAVEGMRGPYRLRTPVAPSVYYAALCK